MNDPACACGGAVARCPASPYRRLWAAQGELILDAIE
jgi:hypothetical protein